MATYGNQHITEISRVQLPEIAQDPEFGVRLCATPVPVVASETETGRLYNDVKGVFVKRSEANDTIRFTLEKDGVDLTPLGDYIGLPYDPLVVAFVIDWRQHLINHGSGCYKLRVNFDIAGVTGEYYEGTFQLFPYGNHTVENTVRLYTYFDSFHSAKGVNFKDSGFHSSIRFGGRFGNRQPNTEINNIKHTDNIQRKIRRENINSYELQTDPLTECFTHDIIDFHLVGENEIFVTDNAAMNHSYRYRDYPVILSETPEFEHTSGRPSSITAKFEDKQLKEYTSFVSSQQANVIEPPVCQGGTVNVRQSDNNILSAVTVASGGTENFVVTDSVITLQNTTPTTISTTNVQATDAATITAPDGTVNVNQSDSTLISAVTTPSDGVSNYNVADSVITLNTNEVTENVKATDALNINIVDPDGNELEIDSYTAPNATIFLYWFQIAVLLFRSRLIDESATFETPEECTDNIIELGESEYDNAIAVITPNGYKSGTLYSIKPDGSSDMSFTQNTANGTRFNSNGEIEVVAANTPRITWVNGKPQILVEESRTNLVTYSEPIQASEVNAVGGVSFNSYSWDIGLTTSCYYDDNSSNRFLTVGSVTSGITYSLIALVEMTDSSEPKIENLDASPDFQIRLERSILTNIEKYNIPNTNIWIVKGTDTVGGSFPTRNGIYKIGSNSIKTFNATGFMLIEGNTSIKESYIPTNGSIATRNDDVYTLTPPAGTTEIVEYLADGTTNTITTIPATYQPAPGMYDKIVFK